MIKVIDNRTDEVLSEIQRDGNILEAEHVEDADSKEETLDFTVIQDYDGLTARNRVLIQDDDENWREFVIENIEDIDDEKEVYSNASYLEDLGNSKPIAPDKKNQYTTKQWLDFALDGTDWEPGIVEFSGFRTISWTGYNTPYELLTIIANRFDMALKFRAEVEYNRVVKRYVDLVHVKYLFSGKEIVRGKDLVEFKRTENTENLATALVALGPKSQDDDGNEIPREVVTVVDDEANDKFNKSGHYIWKIYEPSTDNEDMTRKRLESLARTELNKRKEPEIDYEISAVNLEQYYGHEKVRKYDKVRIKDVEKERYAEANTKRIVRNLLDDTDREFTFGDIVEYEEEDLRAYFDSIVSSLQSRLDKAVSNAENIRVDIDNKLNYYERKIEKSDTPPKEPQEGDLWLDTSGNAGVLYRYENGEWIKSSVTEASEIGAITREQAMYESLINTKESLHVQHLELQSVVYDLLDNEYLVNDEIREQIEVWLNRVNEVFTKIESELDAMSFDTATIGRLVDVQALVVDYRNNVHYLSRSILAAQNAINERFKLLQSQYSEEKFNEAMNEVADTFNLDFVDGKLIGNVILEQNLTDVKNDLQEQLDAARADLDGLEVGGRNLLPIDEFQRWGSIVGYHLNDYVFTLKDTGLTSGVGIRLPNRNLKANKEYYMSFRTKLLSGEVSAVFGHGANSMYNTKYYIDGKFSSTNYDMVPYPQDNEEHLIEVFFTSNSRVESDWIYIQPNRSHYSTAYEMEIWDIQIKEGNIRQDWTPAPEDFEDKITTLNQDIKILEGNLSAKLERTDIEPLNEKIAEHSNELEVNAKSIRSLLDKTELHDGEITKWSNQTSTNAEEINRSLTRLSDTEKGLKQAQLDITQNADGLTERVRKSDYETDQNDIVKKFDGVEAERNLLADQISQRVTETQLTQAIDDIEVGGRNLILDSKEFNKKLGVNYSTISKGVLVPGEYTISFSTDEVKDETDFKTHLVYIGRSIAQVPRNDEGRTSGTFVVKESDLNTSIFLYFGNGAAESRKNAGKFIEVQLEKGNKSTPYEPAPEDFQKELDAHETRIKENETNFEQTEQQLALKAGTREINQSHKTLSRALAELTVDSSSGINFKYDENGLINNFSIGKNGIQFDGSKVKFNATDEIVLRIGEAEKAVADMNIGGKNLIPHTEFKHGEKVQGNWKTWGAAKIRDTIQTDDYLLFLTDNPNNSTATNMGLQSPILTEDLVAGQEYVISFKLNPQAGLETFDYMYLMNEEDGSGNQGLGDFVGVDMKEKRAGQYTVYEFSGVVKPWFNGKARVMFGTRIEPGTYNYFYITQPQIKKGNKTTGYSPAPEDYVQSDKIIAEINLSDEGVGISGEKIDLVGDVFMENGSTKISDAFIESLEVNAANIKNLDAIDIHANSFSSSSPNSNAKITMENGKATFKNGSVNIEASSGRKVIIDGNINRSQTMTPRMPSFRSSKVTEDGSWYRTNSQNYVTALEEYYVHVARYLKVTVAVHRWGMSAWADARMETRAGHISNYVTTNNDSSAVYGFMEIDLGEPLDYPTSGAVMYNFKTRNSNQSKRMHLGNRYLTDNP